MALGEGSGHVYYERQCKCAKCGKEHVMILFRDIPFPMNAMCTPCLVILASRKKMRMRKKR